MERSKATQRAAVGILLLSLSGPALAADAHVHGRAALQVAVDGDRLLLELNSPLDNLVGFEHAPRNDRQIAAVRRMAERLHQPAALFVPTPEAQCTPASVTLASEVLDPALLARPGAVAAPGASPAKADGKGQAKGHDKGKGAHEAHAALTAEIVFRCARAEKLSSLEVRLFDAFSHFRRIDVQVAGARKQAAARLTPNSKRVAW